jgi:hypothetical protein
MIEPNGLYLHEEILLLALRDQEGTVAQGNYPYALGGAILAELLLGEHIRVEDSKKKLVDRVGSSRIGEPLLDECVARIRDAKRRASLPMWVSRFAGTKGLKHRVAAGLCKRGILRADEDKVLLIFTRKIYPERDPEPERQILARLEEAIFTEVRDVDPRTTILLSLAHASGILGANFDRKRLKERKQRIERVVNGEMLGKATREVITSVQMAITVAAVMPAIMAGASHH